MNEVLSSNKTNKRAADSSSRAYNYVCQLLTRRDYTIHEIRTKLVKKQYDEVITEKTIYKFVELRFLNDASYVGKYVRSRILMKPRSRYLLEIELRSKGVSQHVIENYFNEEPLDEEVQAKKLIKSKMKSILRLPQEKRRNKIAYYLSSRGFPLRFIDSFILGVHEKQ